MSKTNDNLLQKNGLVYLPVVVQMREHVQNPEWACMARSQRLVRAHAAL